mmetsp:Transcript_31411/g.51509  ORF Transcript_31411/g.51509 Transcript_31411/m.51509 type:complete len:109 (+) Transcript_31411:914-1240(+)
MDSSQLTVLRAPLSQRTHGKDQKIWEVQKKSGACTAPTNTVYLTWKKKGSPPFHIHVCQLGSLQAWQTNDPKIPHPHALIMRRRTTMAHTQGNAGAIATNPSTPEYQD